MKKQYFVKYLAESQLFAPDGRQLLTERAPRQIEKTLLIHLTKEQLEDLSSIAAVISATTKDKVLAILNMNKL